MAGAMKDKFHFRHGPSLKEGCTGSGTNRSRQYRVVSGFDLKGGAMYGDFWRKF